MPKINPPEIKKYMVSTLFIELLNLQPHVILVQLHHPIKPLALTARSAIPVVCKLNDRCFIGAQDKRLQLKLNANRTVSGVLRGFDPFM